jgi:formylmethanofuran dehydrogenase subunit B
MSAWIQGRLVSLRDALDASGELLAGARLPLVTGLVCEVDAIQAAYRLASDIRGVVDPIASAALYRELEVLAAAGAMTTTPAEVAGRADVVVVLASASNSPLVARLAARRPTRGPTAGAPRSFVLIGAFRPTVAVGENVSQVCEVKVERRELAATIGALRAAANGRMLAGATGAALAPATEILRAASFGVVLYDPAELGGLAIEMVHGFVKDLNQATRFSSLAVTANLQQQSVLQVSVWTTGDAPRVGFGRGYPEHDPWRFDAERLVASGEVDAAMWLASVPIAAPDWLKGLRSIAVIGEPSGNEAEIVLEVSVPGKQVDGVLWDDDRGTLVFRKGEMTSGGVRASEVLEQVAQAVGRARGGAC